MRVFILEDDPDRIMLLREAAFNHDAVFTESCLGPNGAIEVYARESAKAPFDLLLLDHDLGGRTFVDSNEEDTGAAFVRRLPDGGPTTIPYLPDVVIHSYNADGAKNMLATLREKGYRRSIYVPFGHATLRLLNPAYKW